MNKKDAKMTIVVAMLLVLALYFVSGTYARYASNYTGNGTVNVAKWAVKLTKQGETQELQNNFTLQLTPTSSDYVVSGKIAPSISATGILEIDLAGTEVAVEVTAEVDKSGDAYAALPAQIKALIDDGRLTLNATVQRASGSSLSVNSGVVSLPNATTGFTGTDTVVDVVVSAVWQGTSSDSDAINTKDTAAGENVTSFKIPVKLTVQQHI